MSSLSKPEETLDIHFPHNPLGAGGYLPPKYSTTAYRTETEVVESILAEADRLVSGDRGDDYGHPFEDFGRTAGMVSALLGHKLKEPITQEEIAMLMICVKLSRCANRLKRDSVVDIAGYAKTLSMVMEERERRAGA